jgi:hypothetical protein
MSEPTIKKMLERFEDIRKPQRFYWPEDKEVLDKIDEAIRALILASAKGPEVDEVWIRRRVNEARSFGMSDIDSDYFVRAVLKEAGVRIIKK